MLPSRNAREGDGLSGKRESASMDSIVNEALEKMRHITAASPCYEVDRSSAQWTVRRASAQNEKAFPSYVVTELAPARRA